MGAVRAIAVGSFVAACLAGCTSADGAAPAKTQPSGAPSVSDPSVATSATATAPPANVTETEVPSGMIAIPAGITLMGTRYGDGLPEESPPFEAIVGEFFLDATEVTMDAYGECVKAGKCRSPHMEHPFCNARFDGLDHGTGVITHEAEQRGNHPVNCIEWQDAVAYCASVGKRLPSEREWEYAASGGSERRRFSWGADDPDGTRSCYDHPGGTCPVRSFAPGAFGLYDMTGNVWEWTSSFFGPYPTEAASSPFRVYRGGSWSRRFPKWMRNQLRNRYRPEQWSAAIGVRCARSKSPPSCPAQSEPREASPELPTTCVRTSGTPLCDDGYAWDGKACSLAKADGASSASPLMHRDTNRAIQPAEANTASEGAAPLSRERTPQYDQDCKAHYPNTAAAYRFSGGGNFWSRSEAIARAGCTKRDTSVTWTSACCAE